MMISPEYYISRFVDSNYQELMEERDRLIEDIKKYEEHEKAGDQLVEDLIVDPSPEVVYQCNLEYLAQLSLLMYEKYNHEYVWGDKSLAKDAGKDSDYKSDLNDRLLMKFEPIDPEVLSEKIADSRAKILEWLRAIELPENIKQKVISGEIELKDAMEKYLPNE